MRETMKLNILMILVIFTCCKPLRADSMDVPQWLLGTWKSNEKMTLEDMEKVEGMPEKTRAFLADKFFGRLVVIFRDTDSASFFLENIEEKVYEPYENFSTTDTSISFTYYSEILGKEITNTFFREGECIYGVVTKYEFKEFFCPYSFDE